MKKIAAEFFKRGLMCCGFGPIIMAIIYGISSATGAITTVSAEKVSIELLSITAMAFIAAGITVVYLIEKLPLIWAVLLHGIVLYADYLGIYLLNHWMPLESSTIAIFTAVFIAGYAVVWTGIYCSIRHKTKKLNEQLK